MRKRTTATETATDTTATDLDTLAKNNVNDALRRLEKLKSTTLERGAAVEARAKEKCVEVEQLMKAGADYITQHDTANKSLWKLLQQCAELEDKTTTRNTASETLDADAYVWAIREKYKDVAVYERQVTTLDMILALTFKNKTARSNDKISRCRRVINEAREQKIATSDIAAWIEREHGLKAICDKITERKHGATKAGIAKARKQRIQDDADKAFNKAGNIGTVYCKDDTLKQQVDDRKYVLALLRYNDGDNSADVIGVVENDDALEQVIGTGEIALQQLWRDGIAANANNKEEEDAA